ncbi:MAG: 1-acyl-sn-glycerol-3-phosphate acyltransferase [Bacteroidota bacterium]
MNTQASRFKPTFRRLYSFLKGYLILTLNVFYRRRKVVGYQENVPVSGPLLFTPNHQNALIDALNTASGMPRYRQPSFMTRADIFTEKTVPILNHFKMLPIYRQRDGVDVIKKNEEIFKIVVERMARGECTLIFPEGNHNREFRLRPIKKGFGRIAYQVAEELNFEETVHIVPVGLNYKKHRNFKSDLLIIYGKPLSLADYYSAFEENANRALVDLKKDLRKAMQACVIHIGTREHYELVNSLRLMGTQFVAKDMDLNGSDIYDQFKAQKAIIAKVEPALAQDEELAALKEPVAQYEAGLKTLRLRDHILEEGGRSWGSLMMSAIGFILGLPLHLWGVLNHYHWYKLFDYLAVKFFKDDHFHASIRHITGYFIIPFAYLLQSGIVWALTDWRWALGYLALLPLSGEFAMWYSRAFKKWWARIRYRRFKTQNNPLLAEMEATRTKAMKVVKRLLAKQPDAVREVV